MMFKVLITVYFENHMNLINTLCGQNAELMNVEACSTNRYQRALEG
jgi:hypothetical protein